MMQNKHIVTQKFCVTERKFEKGVKGQVIILVYFPIFLYYSSSRSLNVKRVLNFRGSFIRFSLSPKSTRKHLPHDYRSSLQKV